MHRFAFTGGSPKAELHKLHKGLYAVYSVLMAALADAGST